VVFDTVDAAVFEQLYVLQHGHARVLALATDPELLAGPTPFRMLRSGASDVMCWDASAHVCERIAARLKRWQQIDVLVKSELVQSNAIGQSRMWWACLRRSVEIALYAQGPLLLTGESGTGKELIARLVHSLDPRPNKGNFVVLDCTTVVPTLSGSEFFGHERGAFTGAANAREGAFAIADKGTLFLDEVGELPLPLQAQLLRVVQEKTYKRVGGNTWQQTDFRLICATNRDLEAEIRAGGFRGDFFHRIAHSRCQLPALREREDDVLLLGKYFLTECRPDIDTPEFDAAVACFLTQRAYTGNVRELRHLVGRISERHVGNGRITVGDLPPEDLPDIEPIFEWPDSALEAVVSRALSLGVGLKELSRATSEAAIRLALSAEGGNLQRAAKLLKVTDRALQMRRAQGAA
jgi:transcriptional regulator with GAF, ATPase, and Fis domain